MKLHCFCWLCAASTQSRWRYVHLFCQQPIRTENNNNKHCCCTPDVKRLQLCRAAHVVTGVDVFLQEELDAKEKVWSQLEYQVNHLFFLHLSLYNTQVHKQIIRMLACVIGYFFIIGHESQVIIGHRISWIKSRTCIFRFQYLRDEEEQSKQYNVNTTRDIKVFYHQHNVYSQRLLATWGPKFSPTYRVVILTLFQ